MLRLMKRGAQVTVTTTILDGIVAARSVFHHSMHYRSAVVMGPQDRHVGEKVVLCRFADPAACGEGLLKGPFLFTPCGYRQVNLA